MNKKILLIEDNKKHSEMFQAILEKEGYLVECVFNGVDALRAIHFHRYDLVLLDLVLPDINGDSILKAIRLDASTPVIVISSKSRDFDKVFYLNSGADDYLVKPFSLSELVARANASIRRANMLPESKSLSVQYEGTVLQIDEHRVFKNGDEMNLTRTQAKILRYLSMHLNHIVKKEELFEHVWEKPYSGNDNLMNVNVFRIRQIIEEDAKHPKILLSIWGVGYKLISNSMIE